MNHYEALGVPSTATRDEIRIAYRTLARQFHPDAKGDASAVRMARINEAWRVLSDPGRRAVYDALERPAVNRSAVPQPGHSASAATAQSRRVAPSAAPTPARFPWRFMLVLATIGIAFVLVNAALTDPAEPAKPDNLLGPGSCVDIETNGDAREVPCDGNNDGVVEELIALDGICSPDTEGHRDRQGMGLACVQLGVNG